MQVLHAALHTRSEPRVTARVSLPTNCVHTGTSTPGQFNSKILLSSQKGQFCCGHGDEKQQQQQLKKIQFLHTHKLCTPPREPLVTASFSTPTNCVHHHVNTWSQPVSPHPRTVYTQARQHLVTASFSTPTNCVHHHVNTWLQPVSPHPQTLYTRVHQHLVTASFSTPTNCVHHHVNTWSQPVSPHPQTVYTTT